jgi:hypothetical protein
MALNTRMIGAALTISSVAVLGAHPVSADTASARTSAGVSTSTVTWTLTDTRCSHVPRGATLVGLGAMTENITVRIGRDGAMTRTVESHAKGRAMDDKGNVYRWRADKVMNVSNAASLPLVFNGRTKESFTLTGSGPIRLDNGYSAYIPAQGSAMVPISTYGDAYDFTGNGISRCNPL